MTALRKAPAVAYDDVFLVEQFQKGSKKAFYTLYKRHSNYIAGVVYRILGNDEALDDMVQETFIMATSKIDKLRDPERFRFWLVTIAVRHTRQLIKKRRRRSLLTLNHQEKKPGYCDPAKSSRLDEIYEALEKLPGKLRIPWMLRYVEEMTIKEVAVICEASTTTIKRRIKSAQSKLRRNLDANQ